MSSPFSLLLFLLLLSSASSQPQPQPQHPLFPNPCSERCGHLLIPYPFHLNSTCGPPITPFLLSCRLNSLFLTLGPTDLRILSFLPFGSLLLDYSNSVNSSASSCDRWYSDVNHIFNHTPFLAVTLDNVLRLYDCEDSSVCRTGCDKIDGACEGNRGCCYPLADGSVWKSGDGFGVFSEFGCRGFSSWVASRSDSGSLRMERGIEMEWAVPRGFGKGMECAAGAVAVNATVVRGGVRCVCGTGFVGDGFAGGTGCFKSCGNNGNTSYTGDCCKGRLCKKRVAVLVGTLVSIFFLAAATACYFLLRRPCKRTNRWDPEPSCLPKIFAKACRTRLFTYQELDKATKGFTRDQKLVNVTDGTIRPGVLDDGSLVAVQEVRCQTPQNLRQVLDRVERLSQISHKNIARIVGCCIGSSCTLLLVHEFFPNGTLQDLLRPDRGNAPLSWYRRINIATEVASALAHLQSEIFPPVNLQELRSSDIFIVSDYSIKISSFTFLNSELVVSHDSDVICTFGLILLELIMGVKRDDVRELVLAKIKDGRFHEIVDPCLRFQEQLSVQCEQIEGLAGFAVRCLSRERLHMVDVAREFLRIVNDSTEYSSSSKEPALEITFSNSSLLQMVSISPDSIHVP